MEKDLTPIERGARNNIIWHLSGLGFPNIAIAHVMNANQSTVSRIIKKKPKKHEVIPTLLFGAPLEVPRD